MFKATRLSLFPVVLLIAAGVYGWLSTPLPTQSGIGPRFDWPDEMANYYFAQRYAQTGNLASPEPLNVLADNQIHPRSFNVLNGYIIPGSFLGLPIFYGLLAKVFGVGSLPYITPLLGVLGAAAFYGILRRIFSDQIARLSAILLLLHPAWWYYSVTPMLPNVAFISFLLFGLYFLLSPLPKQQPTQGVQLSRKPHRRSLGWVVGAGVCIGIAIAIRPAELIWVVGVVIAAMMLARSELSFSRLALFGICILGAIFPTIYQQQLLYGSWIATGYDQLQAAETACTTCRLAGSLFAPFGVHPYLVGVNFWTHFLSRFWLWTLLGVLGFSAFLTRRTKPANRQYGYLIVGLLVTMFLAIYYGSWEFDDKLTVALNTLGVSYVRYWLPLYALSLPFVAMGLYWLSGLLRRRAANVLLTMLVIGLLASSARLTLWEKPDSILPVRSRIAEYKNIARQVNDRTEAEAVIITVRKDKVFFPDRRVVHSFDALSLRDDLQDVAYNLLSAVPVYYYALGEEPSEHIRTDLRLEEMQRFGSEILYQVKRAL